jgi:hypothetical protein
MGEGYFGLGFLAIQNIPAIHFIDVARITVRKKVG